MRNKFSPEMTKLQGLFKRRRRRMKMMMITTTKVMMTTTLKSRVLCVLLFLGYFLLTTIILRSVCPSYFCIQHDLAISSQDCLGSNDHLSVPIITKDKKCLGLSSIPGKICPHNILYSKLIGFVDSTLIVVILINQPFFFFPVYTTLRLAPMKFFNQSMTAVPSDQ